MQGPFIYIFRYAIFSIEVYYDIDSNYEASSQVAERFSKRKLVRRIDKNNRVRTRYREGFQNM
jgi:hypothetical protein